jgi:signal transduction histidine kinase
MSLQTRIALLFIGLVALLLGVFGAYVYVKSSQLRASEFIERLRERADIAAQIAIGADEFPASEKASLQQQFLASLPNEAIAVYASHDSLLFQRNANLLHIAGTRMDRAHLGERQTWAEARRQYLLERVESRSGRAYYVAVGAEDRLGYEQLDGLRYTLLVGGLLAVAVAGGIAWLFAGWSVVPIHEMTEQAKSIHTPTQRIVAPTTDDELAVLADAFNRILNRLEHAFDMQRSFIVHASHELRTPLMVLTAELHQLRSFATSDAIHETIGAAERTTLHMANLLQQLLWLAQSSQAVENVHREELRFDEVAFMAIQRARERYPSRVIQMDVSSLAETDQEPLVYGNGPLLEAAFYNLVVNACKYGIATAPVEVSVWADQRSLHFEVCDRGTSLAPEILARLKEPFYRAPVSASVEGSGIGLTLTDRIAALHSGELKLSARENGGLRVDLQVPFYADR